MKILFANARLQREPLGGGQVHTAQFVQNALALSHEIWVFPGSDFPGVHILPAGKLQQMQVMRKLDALYLRLEYSSPDICSWALPPKRTIYGFPVVAWEFNTLPDELNKNIPSAQLPPVQRYLSRFSSGCDLAVCVSPALAQVVSETLHPKQILIVPNGSDPQLFTPEAEIAARMLAFRDCFNVIWIGTLKESWHDLETLRQAAALLWDEPEGKKIVFHLIGPGMQPGMADMPSNVFYWGAESYQRLPRWLAGMNVGLVSYSIGSSHYNSPLKVFDYLASGLPVVSSEHPVVRELLSALLAEDLLFPIGDSQALATALLHLAQHPERAKQIGQAGRKLIQEHYTWQISTATILQAMQEILARKVHKR